MARSRSRKTWFARALAACHTVPGVVEQTQAKNGFLAIEIGTFNVLDTISSERVNPYVLLHMQQSVNTTSLTCFTVSTDACCRPVPMASLDSHNWGWVGAKGLDHQECKQEAIMVFGLGSQLRPCLRVSAFIICLMVVSMFYILNFGNSSNLLHQVVIVAAEKNSSLNMYVLSQAKDGYLVWTPSCQIPELDPYHPSIKNMLSRSDPIICSKHGPLTYVRTRDNSSYSLMIDSGMISQYVPPHQKLFCCYSIVTRVTASTENYNSSADNLYNISKCVNFDEEVILEPNEEFILVKCHSKKTSKSSKQKEVYNNIHAVVQIKESIISKLEENKKCEPCKDKDSRKLNVILVGLDSMSRSSLIRTMPNTVSHLRHNGWTELKGYNKIGDNTFPNLMAILTGYSVKELEHLCWPGRKSKMDDCPFLWKDFSRQGYVTAYVEDEPEIGITVACI
uniref:Uncharacterized protein n=1 Tax=Timema shepardi TaxID=629360 RepID=A0A7R9AST6_TIMSH|nr:unnamed protein product [Timema shepardi]